MVHISDTTEYTVQLAIDWGKVVIRWEKEFIDMMELKFIEKFEHKISKKVVKGAWRMPWLSETMKDVLSCEKLQGAAQKL